MTEPLVFAPYARSAADGEWSFWRAGRWQIVRTSTREGDAAYFVVLRDGVQIGPAAAFASYDEAAACARADAAGDPPKPERVFSFDLDSNFSLSVSEIWPDGDAPENPEVEDVVKVVRADARGSLRSLVERWDLWPESLRINGRLVDLRPSEDPDLDEW